MPHADLLLTNGWVLTMDPRRREFHPGFVAVRGPRIAAVGPMAEAAPWTAARTLDAAGGLILPGLVNTHTHAAMTCFRGMADDLPLMDWLQNHIFPAEARLDHGKVKIGTRLACAEMILSGTRLKGTRGSSTGAREISFTTLQSHFLCSGMGVSIHKVMGSFIKITPPQRLSILGTRVVIMGNEIMISRTNMATPIKGQIILKTSPRRTLPTAATM